MSSLAELSSCSHVVVGAGIIGSWTAWHLQRELGEAGRVALVDSFPLPHTRGSSHGGSRVIRFLGDDDLAKLDYSLDMWHGLEEETGQVLHVTTGLINLGECEPNTGECKDNYLLKHMGVLERAGKPYEWLGAEEVKRRYPSLKYPDRWGAVSDPSGAILLAHRCLTFVQQSFVGHGGLLVQAQVQAVAPASGDRVAVEMNLPSAKTPSSLTFSRVVVCTGPWTSKLLPSLGPLLTVQAIPVTYWRDNTASATYSVASNFPVIFNARLTNIYGVPSYEYPGLVKVLSHLGPKADPDARDQPSTDDVVAYVARYVEEHLPGLDHSCPAILEKCLYTCTPDSQPIMDTMAAIPGLVIGCGFSGSGFKHSPASGRMLALLALGRESQVPESFQLVKCRLDRFQG